MASTEKHAHSPTAAPETDATSTSTIALPTAKLDCSDFPSEGSVCSSLAQNSVNGCNRRSIQEFCPRLCGVCRDTGLSTSTSSTGMSSNPRSGTVAAVVRATAVSSTVDATNTSGNSTGSKSSRSSRRLPWWWILIIVLLVLCCIAGVVAAVLMNKNENEPNPSFNDTISASRPVSMMVVDRAAYDQGQVQEVLYGDSFTNTLYSGPSAAQAAPSLDSVTNPTYHGATDDEAIYDADRTATDAADAPVRQVQWLASGSPLDSTNSSKSAASYHPFRSPLYGSSIETPYGEATGTGLVNELYLNGEDGTSSARNEGERRAGLHSTYDAEGSGSALAVAMVPATGDGHVGDKLYAIPIAGVTNMLYTETGALDGEHYDLDGSMSAYDMADSSTPRDRVDSFV